MRVSQLYDNPKIRGREAYVVGLGASMAAFPIQWLRGRFCVLLNDAARWFPGLGPLVVANDRRYVEPPSPSVRWNVVKGRHKSDPGFLQRDDNHVAWDHPQIFAFSYDPEVSLSDSWERTDCYWPGSTAVGFALQLLARCHVSSITLVGCDCGEICGTHYFSPEVEIVRRQYSHNRHIKSGRKPLRHDYRVYEESLFQLKLEIERRFSIPVLSLTPFIGLSGVSDQFRRMKPEAVPQPSQRPKPPPPRRTNPGAGAGIRGGLDLVNAQAKQRRVLRGKQS